MPRSGPLFASVHVQSNCHIEYPTTGEPVEAFAAEEEYGLRDCGRGEEETQKHPRKEYLYIPEQGQQAATAM